MKNIKIVIMIVLFLGCFKGFAQSGEYKNLKLMVTKIDSTNIYYVINCKDILDNDYIVLSEKDISKVGAFSRKIKIGCEYRLSLLQTITIKGTINPIIYIQLPVDGFIIDGITIMEKNKFPFFTKNLLDLYFYP